jgi:hypothetical protein
MGNKRKKWREREALSASQFVPKFTSSDGTGFFLPLVEVGEVQRVLNKKIGLKPSEAVEPFF